MIFGIAGGCRGGEMPNIKIADIKEQGFILLIDIKETKNYVRRSFTIEGPFLEIVQRYVALCPKSISTDRFFLNYQKGECTKQVIGKNKLALTPKVIADYLKLPNPVRYIGHSFRRTSATLLANTGVNIRTIQRRGGWKSPVVAEVHVADCISNKRKTGNLITREINLPQSKSDVLN